MELWLFWCSVLLLMCHCLFSLAAVRLNRLVDSDDTLTAVTPVKNVLLVYEAAGRDRGEAYAMMASLVLMPLLAAVFLVLLAGSLMHHTGRAKAMGYTITIPPFTLFGLLAIVLTAKRYYW